MINNKYIDSIKIKIIKIIGPFLGHTVYVCLSLYDIISIKKIRIIQFLKNYQPTKDKLFFDEDK